MADVILVDECDREVGLAEKLYAHRAGLLHRAFSVLIFNPNGEILLQKRASGKYHSGGLWTNTCCSHPLPGEALDAACSRRLSEEMGFTAPLDYIGHLLYRTEMGPMTEHEYDHVFFGRYSGEVSPNPDEVSEFKWIAYEELLKDLAQSPERFTSWFRLIMERFQTEIRNFTA